VHESSGWGIVLELGFSDSQPVSWQGLTGRRLLVRDPHVKTLIYRVETEPTLVFDNPPPVEHQTRAFKIRLADGIVTVTMQEHHASEESACRTADAFLRAWEITAALQFGRPDMRFMFERAEVIDRDPPPTPPGSQGSITIGGAMISGVGTVEFRAFRKTYPAPPGDFAVSPDVVSMWHRYEGFLRKREPLLSMAYFCLTVVTSSAQRFGSHNGLPRNKAASALYSVDFDVLETAYKLTDLGDARTGRKMQNKSRPLTDQETAWVEAVTKSLIRRVGETAANPSGPHRQLTMNDFPQV
jgi:hypothetical protein